ncbi:hypothetical protein K439DRAFT_1625031 [Ramaria rubella]|nr:hypothetical protein K439DRAFT_1625031 [Ramaria rubella]
MSSGMYYEAKCQKLQQLFNALSETLPLALPNFQLPQLDFAFWKEEGAWPALNKALHASFGDKSVGITITERGPRLTQTMALICWCLQELGKTGDEASAELVNLWITALATAAEAAGAKPSQKQKDHRLLVQELGFTIAQGRSRRIHQPSHLNALHEEAATANGAAAASQGTADSLKRKSGRHDPKPMVLSANSFAVFKNNADDNVELPTNADDAAYVPTALESDSSEEDSGEEFVTNAEVSEVLPQKTIPEIMKKTGTAPAARAASQAGGAVIQEQSKKHKRKDKSKQNHKGNSPEE